MTTIANLYADIPSPLPEELVHVITIGKSIRIERIVSHGQSSPEGSWYDQDQHEFVVVLQGAAQLRFDDESVDMQPGDFLNIPAHRRHRVEWTDPSQPTIWLAIHYVD